jgi:hypothetical protein
VVLTGYSPVKSRLISGQVTGLSSTTPSPWPFLHTQHSARNEADMDRAFRSPPLPMFDGIVTSDRSLNGVVDCLINDGGAGELCRMGGWESVGGGDEDGGGCTVASYDTWAGGGELSTDGKASVPCARTSFPIPGAGLRVARLGTARAANQVACNTGASVSSSETPSRPAISGDSGVNPASTPSRSKDT